MGLKSTPSGIGHYRSCVVNKAFESATLLKFRIKLSGELQSG